MERAAFLLEDTGERISCMLNPDSVTMRRVAGIRTRESASGPLTASGLADDPLLFTGGGSTELSMDLLFDISLAGTSLETDDVRELTKALWSLAENATGDDEIYGSPRTVRFVWGKYWNIPGVVASVAERLEFFTESGAPRRSWLRLRMLRMPESLPGDTAAAPVVEMPLFTDLTDLDIPPEAMIVHETSGSAPDSSGEDPDGFPGERPDELSHRYLGDASAWRWVVAPSGIDDPLHVPPGTTLRIPPPGAIRETA